MRHFLSTLDGSRAELEGLLDEAAAHKAERESRRDLAGKTVALVSPTLLGGAASQATRALNLALGFDELRGVER